MIIEESVLLRFFVFIYVNLIPSKKRNLYVKLLVQKILFEISLAFE